MGEEIRGIKPLWQSTFYVQIIKNYINDKSYSWKATSLDNLGIEQPLYSVEHCFRSADLAIKDWQTFASLNMISEYQISNPHG